MCIALDAVEARELVAAAQELLAKQSGAQAVSPAKARMQVFPVAKG